MSDSFLAPVGATENSPAIYRWACDEKLSQSPGGTIEEAARKTVQPSLRDCNQMLPLFPAINRWAIFMKSLTGLKRVTHWVIFMNSASIEEVRTACGSRQF